MPPVPPPPGEPPNFVTPPRPAPGRPRPTCKVLALYLENCANASRQTDRTETEDRDRDTDNPLYRYRLGVRRQNSTTAEEVAIFQHLFPNPNWLMSGKTSGYQNLVSIFSWIYNCLKTKR